MIRQILRENDEYCQSLSLGNFLVLEKGSRLVGTVKLECRPDFIYLSSLAVMKEEQRKGFAKEIMLSVISNQRKPLYLYTIIPAFFTKFGFSIVPDPGFLPSKDAYECEDCSPEKCVCMKREYP